MLNMHTTVLQLRYGVHTIHVYRMACCAVYIDCAFVAARSRVHIVRIGGGKDTSSTALVYSHHIDVESLVAEHAHDHHLSIVDNANAHECLAIDAHADWLVIATNRRLLAVFAWRMQDDGKRMNMCACMDTAQRSLCIYTVLCR
jgi:hypothetical protein